MVELGVKITHPKSAGRTLILRIKTAAYLQCLPGSGGISVPIVGGLVAESHF